MLVEDKEIQDFLAELGNLLEKESKTFILEYEKIGDFTLDNRYVLFSNISKTLSANSSVLNKSLLEIHKQISSLDKKIAFCTRIEQLALQFMGLMLIFYLLSLKAFIFCGSLIIFSVIFLVAFFYGLKFFRLKSYLKQQEIKVF